jgi:CMP-N-acetylneuraminic acid synthetase
VIKGQSVIGIIPARGGSKGLPGKNILPMNGKPLLEWSIIAAQGSQYLDDIVVSTDDTSIAHVAEQCGLSVPILRPAELATDTASTLDTVLHTLAFYRTHLGKTFDIVCLLEPTSPLREATDIDTMLESLIENHEHYDGIVSIGEIQAHPSIVKKIESGKLVPYFPEPEKATRRQDLSEAFFPFGVAYIVKTHTLLTEKTFYPARCNFHKIKRYQCYEIDDVYDFISVEAIMKHEWRV